MTYRDLLDFKNQKIVDSIYEIAKNHEDSEELNQAYQEISERNISKTQNAHYQYQIIMDRVSKIIGIIGMAIFAILFIVFGSFILASILYWINAVVGEGMAGIQTWMTQWGTSVYDVLFSSMVGSTGAELITTDGATFLQGFYILGAATLLVIAFSILYFVSMMRYKKKDKLASSVEEKEITLEKSYEILQCQEDDSWKYIQFSLKRKLKRKNKDFYKKYYQSYLNIFYSYHEVEGCFHELDTTQKIKLCVFSTINIFKNFLGSLTKPIFFSAVVIWLFIRTFTYTDAFTLKTFLSSSFGEKIYSFFQWCYDFVSNTLFLPLVQNDNLELSYFISFCIVISIICIIYNWCSQKFIESYRQVIRRMNFYYKINNGIYDKDKKYEKSYFYSIEFTILVMMCVAVIGIPYLDQNYDPLLSIPFEQKEFVKESLGIKDNIEGILGDYVKEKGHSLIDEKIRDGSLIVYRSVVKESKDQELGYLSIEVYPNPNEASSMMDAYRDGVSISWKHHQTSNIDYYISNSGFLIRDKGTIIAMCNKEEFSTPGNDLMPLQKSLSSNEIKALLSQIGYNL